MWAFDEIRDLKEEAKRNEELRNSRKKERPLEHFHIRRVYAQIKVLAINGVTEEWIPARIFLHDFSSTSVKVFCSKPIPEGASIALTIPNISNLYAPGRVISCHEYEISNRIISPNQFKFRAEIAFVFTTDAARETIADYSKLLLGRYVQGGVLVDTIIGGEE